MDKKIVLADDFLENVYGGSKIPYIVKTGDTLGALANKFHCSVDDICKWNHITDPNVIVENQKLIFKF